MVAVHTGAEGSSIAAGTVGSPLTGAHGTLTLNTDGSYTYTVNQSDAVVQALHTSADTTTDVFNYTIQDTGGLQDTATLTITIHGADDLPQAVADTGTMTEDDAPTSFNVIANDTQDPDSTASNAITVGPGSITVTGPGGETFVNTDATASIVSNQVQVSLVNADFQQLALGQHATVTVPYTLTGDTGETSSANLVVTVNGVNDVPTAVDDSGSMTEDQVGTFSVLANDILDADHGAPNNVTTGTVGNLVAPSGENIDLSDIGISVNGSNQVVVTLGSDFQHMQQGQTATFDVPYTLHGDQAGDTSSATLHVTVNGVNDAPTANAVTFTGVDSANYNTDLIVNDPTDGAPTTTGPFKIVTASLLSLSNASDVDGPNPLTFVPGTITTTDGGKVVLQADGDFVFTPKVGDTNSSDSFSFTVTDGNSPTPGTVTATATIALQGPHIWYVDASAAAGGDGSSEHPFNSLAPLNGVGNNGSTSGDVDNPGDIIFLANGTYTGGITLENNEQLISESNGLVVADGGGGGGGTVTLVAASGANAVVQGGVVLASGNNIQGVDFGTTSGFALSGSNVGTVHVDDTTSGVINNASGGGVSIAGSSNVLNMNFSSVTAGGGTNGIALAGSSGTFHAHGGTISGASGAEVSLSGGSVTFTEDGAVNNTNGTNVSISNMTGGTQSFTGAITGHGIALSSNTGATDDFSGGLSLSTGASNAFSATGGGTVNITGSGNTLTTTTGTALDVANTNIGTSGLTFQSISATGSSNSAGIILDTTGSSGGLTVTGTGSAGSGGTIADKTGADILTGTDAGGQSTSGTNGTGIYLHSTSNVSLTDMSLHDFSNFGIYGDNVTGFTLANSTISGTNGTNNAGDREEGDIRFDNLLGSASITGSAISGGYTQNVEIFNTSGTLNRLTLNSDTFGLLDPTGTGTSSNVHDNDNVLLEAYNTAIAKITLTNSDFLGTVTDFFAAIGNNTSVIDVVADNNIFHNGQNVVSGGGTAVDVRGTSSATFDISGNTLTDGGANSYQAAAIFVAKDGGSGTYSGTIENNDIGPEGTVSGNGANADGIFVRTSGSGTLTTLIQGNTLTGYGDEGIHLQNNAGSVTMNASIFGNTESSPAAENFAGLYVDNGAANGDTSTTNVVVGSDQAGQSAEQNTFHGQVVDVGLENDQSSGTTVNLSKNGSPSTTVTGVIDDDNVGSPSVDTSGGNGTVTLVNTLPTLPPLLAAPGGVQAASPTPGVTDLTQAELDAVVAAAIADWAAAGASASQLAALHAVTFSVADLPGNILGEENSPTQITIDTNADGNGWFVDSTPSDNSEFPHAQNAAGTDLLTDPTNAAAGHMDLLTAVSHELGHVLGLPDSTAASTASDLMYINLVDGERRLPDAADVAQVNAATTQTYVNQAQASEAALPVSAQPQNGAPIVVGTAGNDTIDAGSGGHVLFGGAGADNFVFGPSIQLNAPAAAAAQPITHVADYSAAQGDTFDFSALTSAFHASNIADASLVRAVEDPSGTFATLQLNTNADAIGAASRAAAQPSAVANWVNVAQIDGAHAGDPVDVLVDSHAAIHLAQIHATLLV